MSYIGQGLPADSFQGFTTDSFTGDGSATTFTLSKKPFDESALLVVINNVVQKPTTNFTVSGTTLTIVGTAVASGDVIYATHIGGALPIGQAVSVDLNGASDQLILDADADTTISADTDDQIDFKAGGTDIVEFNATGVIIRDGTTITTADNSDTLTLKSTDADATEGPNLILQRDSGSPADGDDIARIDFDADNDAGEVTRFVTLRGNISDVSDGSEDGQFLMQQMIAGSEVNTMRVKPDEIVFNDSSIDLDFRVESNDGTHALFVDAGNNVVIVGGIDGSGTTPAPTNTNGGSDPVFQLQGGNNGNQSMFHISAAINAQNNPGSIVFSKSRDNTLNGNTILQNGDRIGEIVFCAADGTDRNSQAAFICADVDGTPGENDMPGRLEFHTTFDGSNTASEKMRIHNHGQVLVGNNLVAENSQKLHVSTTGTSPGFGCDSQVTSLGSSNTVMEVSCKTSATSAYRLFRGLSGNGSTSSFNDNEFIFNGAGGLAIDGSYTSGGADYAEMFEWKDGNSSSEDRRGYSVVLDGNQIVKATESDDASKIIGIVSALPVLIGDSDMDEKWKSKYLKDDFGNFVLEEYTTTTWTETNKNSNNEVEIKEHSYATDRIPSDVTVPSDAVVKSTHDDGTKITRKKLNPEWDSSQTYVRRQDRKEWDAIGLMGKLRLRKGQPTGTNWIKMRDISDTVEEWLVR